jgi:hypothetical protein
MGLKRLFMTMFSVLFRPETFWKEIREHRREVNAMKDYAAPVIAMVQLCKIPFIGVPRMAMFAAIISFIVDVAVLYLLSGAIFSILGRDQPESVQHDVMTMLSYSLTPIWLAEPFYFLGPWRWVFLAAALLHTLFISRFGLQAMFDKEVPHIDALSGKSTMLVALATMTSFMLMSGIMRFFTSF